MEVTEKKQLPRFWIISGRVPTAPWGGKNSSQRGKPEPEGSKEGESGVYLHAAGCQNGNPGRLKAERSKR